jgi:uncharacterized membrane protein
MTHGRDILAHVEPAETTRLEAFSDGIFAIAITLLILEVRVPESGAGLWRALRAQWPSYFGYALSFLIIGIMWANHSHIFRLIRRTDHMLSMLNLLLLMTIAFLPFPTAVLARNIADPATRAPATILYSGSILLTAIPWSLLWRHAESAGLVDGPDDEIQRIRGSFRLGWIPWLMTTLLALFAPAWAMAGVVVLTIYWLVFPGRRQR